MNDPESLQLNIQHYKELLHLHSDHFTHERVIDLLAEALARLPEAEAPTETAELEA